MGRMDILKELPVLDTSFPRAFAWVDGLFVEISEDGSVSFTCDGDVKVPYRTLRKVTMLAAMFMNARSTVVQ